MSLAPWVVDELLSDIYNPLRELDNYFGRVYDQNFGLGLLGDDLLRSRARPTVTELLVPLRSGYLRPLRHTNLEDSGTSTVSNKSDQFQVNLDVQQFKPEEIEVKVADGYVIIDGKHEEKQDQHGFVSRQFTRKYKLPENIIQEKITSNISSDGILSITAPKKVEAIKGNERQIPIVQTNKPAIKATEKNDKGEKMDI